MFISRVNYRVISCRELNSGEDAAPPEQDDDVGIPDEWLKEAEKAEKQMDLWRRQKKQEEKDAAMARALSGAGRRSKRGLSEPASGISLAKPKPL